MIDFIAFYSLCRIKIFIWAISFLLTQIRNSILYKFIILFTEHTVPRLYINYPV